MTADDGTFDVSGDATTTASGRAGRAARRALAMAKPPVPNDARPRPTGPARRGGRGRKLQALTAPAEQPGPAEAQAAPEAGPPVTPEPTPAPAAAAAQERTRAERADAPAADAAQPPRHGPATLEQAVEPAAAAAATPEALEQESPAEQAAAEPSAAGPAQPAPVQPEPALPEPTQPEPPHAELPPSEPPATAGPAYVPAPEFGMPQPEPTATLWRTPRRPTGPLRAKPPRPRLRRVAKGAGVGTAILLVLAAVPAIGGLTVPGDERYPAKVAQWSRDHGLGWVITDAERIQYALHPPRKGGEPAAIPQAPTVTPTADPARAVLPAPAPVTVQAVGAPAIPNEGAWSVVTTVQGLPAIYTAFVRPDTTHTSYLTGLALLDPHLVDLTLHPGTVEPGRGPWTTPDHVDPKDPHLLAAFNGGFRIQDSRGGFADEGRIAVPLVNGQASLTLDQSGRPDILRWAGGDALPPGIVAVRQNLVLLVDNGEVSADVASEDPRVWGFTIGNAKAVWRSGIGVRADGRLVYAAGAALTVTTLANILHGAGAVRAMELDINPDWTSFVRYTASPTGISTATNLAPDMQRSPDRYNTASARDFVSIGARDTVLPLVTPTHPAVGPSATATHPPSTRPSAAATRPATSRPRATTTPQR
jgi:hypothetical protein